MGRDAGVRDRIRYRVDNTLARGTMGMVLWLAITSLAIVLLAGSVAAWADVAPEGEPPLGFAEASWASLVRTLDPGTMGADRGWGYRWLMLAVTIGGIFVISTLIGAITSGIDSRLMDLRKGRSRVIEANHTVILGWWPQVFVIVEELAEANRNQRRPAIVVLAPVDKVEMEDQIAAKVPRLSGTRVICRTGDPLEPGDLSIVGVEDARSIIVLSGRDHDSDAEVIKTVLAIARHAERRQGANHVVAAIRDPRNAAAAALAGGDDTYWVQVGDFVARVIAQTCRQAGLSAVYTDLLNFEGDEVYFAGAEPFVGMRFGDVLNQFETSVVIGLRSGAGVVQLRPDMERVVAADDTVVLITADDDTGRANGHAPPTVDVECIRDGNRADRCPERTVILGWNWRAASIVRELDNYVAAGSLLRVVAACDLATDARRVAEAGLTNQSVEFQCGDTTDRTVLDGLDLESADHVVVLSCIDDVPPREADARTLMTLLHLRDIAAQRNAHYSIVTEVTDATSQRLAESADVDDFVVSDRMVSQILAQVSENQDLCAVFEDLFDARGSEIYLRPASEYVVLQQPVTFYTVVESARRRGEVAIGYRLVDRAASTALGHGVVINPRKPERITFGDRDLVIVLAED